MRSIKRLWSQCLRERPQEIGRERELLLLLLPRGRIVFLLAHTSGTVCGPPGVGWWEGGEDGGGTSSKIK
jgi:hypothetical protein